MGTVRQSIRRFLTAEEVPRWFGLSIVLIYLVGLGAVARFGMAHARRDSARQLRDQSLYAVNLLAGQISSLAHDVDSGVAGDAIAVPDPLAARFRAALREFTAGISVRWIRIVNDAGQVIVEHYPGPQARQSPTTEANVAMPPEAGSYLSHVAVRAVREDEDGDAGDLLVRVSVPGADRGESAVTHRDGSTNADAGEHGLFVEACLPADPFRSSTLVDQAMTLTTVLIVLGALFVVYRCLREQLRSVSRIADRLRRPRVCIEDDLNSLRIADTLDGVTTAWNELIDLTERLLNAVRRSEADQELSRALERSNGGALAEALSALPDGIIYITEETRFEYVNSTARRLLHWNEEQAAQANLSTAQAHGVGGKVLEVIRDALQFDGTFEGRTIAFDAEEEGGGDQSSYRIRVLPLHRGRAQGECVVLIRDVSQQVRADRAREEFIAQVTHELRTPLTNIRAYTETLSSGMFDDPNMITECYNVITKETRRLSRLVEDVLSVSQLEVGTIELTVADVDLKALLSEGVRDVRGLADDKNIDVQLELPSKFESVQGDRDKLAVVVNNLLGNAIKYTPAGGRVVVGCQFAANAVVISVKDTGIGIEPEDHSRVFEKFQRASDPEVLRQPGTGIGLFTAREIIRRHRGDIELISRKGQGATFLVRLPFSSSRASILSNEAREE